MLNIVVPMAGAGSRFAKAGYTDPKPLIPVHGVPMIQLVINNLRPATEHRFIFVVQREHATRYGLKALFSQWAPGSELIEIDGVTQGAACTCLLAADLINNDDPLMIANSDQYVDASMEAYLDEMARHQADGLIMTMTANDPKWSFVGYDAHGVVNRVVEKEVISDEATVGIYNFGKGSDFVRLARQMVEEERRMNGEFYVAPVYNELIEEGGKVVTFNIGSEAVGMYGLGIPSDLDLFLSLDVSHKAVGAVR
ncbi:glycosyltransferase family 2 protein [Silvimonas amylolytica]|uniref:Glycosyl transferase family 2 n=1 Tax=Silvimonas amylolytica TaxID=449663 RepID=A0ABQ2PIZ7_9NEIS|nr:glycosyltransferase family 2 protein [Silvimonas amylolytica]GGP25442.1 glycosyl transferase family 2 [Silvimonas amylolytica]